jgi:hypothetical protein
VRKDLYLGSGLYFDDCLSKAALRCGATESENRGFLLLCEVKLGVSRELVRRDSSMKAGVWESQVDANALGKKWTDASGKGAPNAAEG